MGLLFLEIRTDGSALYPINDAIVEQSIADRRTFFDSDQLIVLATARSASLRLDSRKGMEFISELHAALATVEGVNPRRIRSLATLVDPRRGESLITTANFLDKIPESDADYRALLKRIDASPLAHGLFISAGGHAAAIYVPILPDFDRNELVDKLQELIPHWESDFDLRLTGPVAAEVMLGRAVFRDLSRLVPIMVALVAFLVFACFRSIGCVLIAMGEVLMVLVITMGLMGLSRTPVTLVTTILPVLVMTIALSDEIHLLDRFRTHLGSRTDQSRARDSMRLALDELARPIVQTSLTTSLGFLSFLSASVIPLREFGFFAAIGVLVAMCLSFTFVPALVLLLPVSWFVPRSHKTSASGLPSLPWPMRFIARHETASAVLGLLILLVTLPGLARLRVDDSWVKNFDRSSEITSAERDFNEEFWGSYRIDVVLEGTEQLFFHRAAGLRIIDSVEQLAAIAPHVGGVVSHRIAFQIVADTWELTDRVPDLPEETVRRIARLLNPVQRRTDMDQLLGADGSRARVRFFVKSADYDRTREIIAFLDRNLPPLLANTGIEFHLSGDLPVAQAVVDSIVNNTLRSIGWTGVGVVLLLAFLLHSWSETSIRVVPLIGGIVIVLGIMGYSGMPLGIASSLFIAAMIGVAVDFAIHFCHCYGEHRNRGFLHETALIATFGDAGHSIGWNALILSVGLIVLGFSTLKPNRDLGILLSGSIVTCCSMTLLVLPRLLRWVDEHSPS